MKGVYVGMDKRTSLVIPNEIYWKAVAFGAKNQIKGGFKGVVMEGLNQLLSLEDKESVSE